MKERTFPQPGLKTTAEYEAAVDTCLQQMKQVHEQMSQDEAEIERLRSETRKLLAEIKAA